MDYEEDRQCRVKSGRWWAPHLGHHLKNPRLIDINHLVPLKNALLPGGWAWEAGRMDAYANYMVAIISWHNWSKGNRGPEERVPPDNALR